MNMLIATFLTVLIDQSLKYYLISTQSPQAMLNQGVAFGVGEGWFSLIGLGFALLLAVFTRMRPRLVWIALSITIASNIVDRLRYGGIVDYLSVGQLHLNLSDILICLLTAWIGWRILIAKDATEVASLHKS